MQVSWGTHTILTTFTLGFFAGLAVANGWIG